ncbi:SPOR domain-containing protein [uncultured Corynebacterium sp.]|uniref:SPOR domain-containing protein n=1 Tax=uncultured Corynebacterium sp. TaxID=159447 RepID=UPI0025F46C3B|nr:SPOR domain-containing protein [uncultured Corynebacterium sp.]
MSSDQSDQKWYFDTSTGEVTEGKVLGWDTRMGPYDSRQDAERALETARARTTTADEWDDD